ncbi:tRNA pseudouridine(38-40) synthase TruA [Buchnera aphidicola]|uniref:tRNA pseudouridine(38-40) synthase TruA n=1 Tax=Buchnera aphidicola TaxID=9 RepID=UPI0034645B25
MYHGTHVIKFALGVEYDGSYYHGWQEQKSGIASIQEEVEKAISIIANHKIKVFCAGRTDSKVHSLGQVIHFYTTAIRKNISWILGINSYLPNSISIQWIRKVSQLFHARYSAVSRCYRYIIYNNKFRSPIYYNKTTHIHHNLNVENMYKASQLILGEHDFTSFRSSTCQACTTYRKIVYINVSKFHNFVFIDIKANSFLQYMVRNIVGCLIEIGKMKKNFEWIKYVLEKKNRLFCAPTAIANGLYLFTINYPSYFNIPSIYF